MVGAGGNQMWETPYYLAVKKVMRFKGLDAAVKINEIEKGIF